MIGLRNKPLRQFGALVAGLAFYLQLAFASWGMLVLAAPSDPSDPFGGHALCLSGDSNTTQPEPSRPNPAAPAHDHFAFCCFWHSLPGVTPQADLVPLPVIYAAVALVDLDATAFTPRRHHGPASARAPPTLA